MIALTESCRYFCLGEKKSLTRLQKGYWGCNFIFVHITILSSILDQFGQKKCCCVDLQLLGEFKTLNFASRR